MKSCPNCKTNTLTLGYDKAASVNFEYCTTCKGQWIKSRDLNTVLEQKDEDFFLSETQRSHLLCPSCDHTNLSKSHYMTTKETVAFCKSCHCIWLDKGKFQKIKAKIKFHNSRLGIKMTSPQEHNIGGIKGALLSFVNSSLENIIQTFIENKNQLAAGIIIMIGLLIYWFLFS